jgi:hypothetical protein
MKYKGFVIAPDFYPDGGTRKNPKPDYYNILDPMNNGRKHSAEDTIEACKRSIDELLVTLNMKSNNLRDWEKLEGFKLEDFNYWPIDEVQAWVKRVSQG